MKNTNYAIIERRGNHFAIICNYATNCGEYFENEIVFEGTCIECHNFADAHGLTTKTRECWENMLRKGSVSLKDMATLVGC